MSDKYFEEKVKTLICSCFDHASCLGVLQQIARDQREACANNAKNVYKNYIPFGKSLREENLFENILLAVSTTEIEGGL